MPPPASIASSRCDSSAKGCARTVCSAFRPGRSNWPACSKAIAKRGHIDAVAYADLASDLLLTARKLEKHLGGETLDNRYVEELIGKTWRKNDRTPIEGLDLVEYAFLARVTADDYVIRESRFIDLVSGTHYSEKQILPAFLAKRSEPKRSFARSLLRSAAGGIYPGFAPHRLDLETVPTPGPLEAAHVATLVERAHASVSSALAAFQEHRRDVFAPDAFPLTLCADLVVVEDGRLRIADAAGDALHVPMDPRLDEMLSMLRRGRLLAVIGDMISTASLPRSSRWRWSSKRPTDRIVGVSAGSSSLNGPKITVQDRAAGGPVWLEEARRAGVSAAAIALGEVRLEMAEALITGLAGLTARTIEPLVSRLTDLGLREACRAPWRAASAARPGRPTRRLHQGASGRRPRTRQAGWSDDGRYIDAGATRARREHRDPAASGSARTPRVSRRSTRGQAQSLRGGLASREALRGVVARRVAPPNGQPRGATPKPRRLSPTPLCRPAIAR